MTTFNELTTSTRIFLDVPARYCNANFQDEETYEKVKKLLEEDRGCYFFGGAGTGKTYLLYAIYKRLRTVNIRARVWNVPDELANLRLNYGEQGQGERGIDDEIRESAILLVDDFGAEKATEWNTEIMYRMINFRYENMLPTFFASNLSLQALAERSGDRLASRIAEMCDVVEMDGKDRRVKSS